MSSDSLSRLRLVQVAFTKSPALRHSALLIIPTLVSLTFAVTPYSKLSSQIRYPVVSLLSNFAYSSVPTVLSKFLQSEAHINKMLFAGLGVWILPAVYSVLLPSFTTFPMWSFVPVIIWVVQQALFMWWIIRKTFQDERIASHLVPNPCQPKLLYNPFVITGTDPKYPGLADQSLPRLKELNLSVEAPIAPKISQREKQRSISFGGSKFTNGLGMKELAHRTSPKGLVPTGAPSVPLEPDVEESQHKFKFELEATDEVTTFALRPAVSFMCWNPGTDCPDRSNKWCDDGPALAGTKEDHEDRNARDKSHCPTAEGPEGKPMEEQGSNNVVYVPGSSTWGSQSPGPFSHSRLQTNPSIFVGVPTERPATAQPVSTAQPEQRVEPVTRPVGPGSITYQAATPLSKMFRNHHVAFLYFFAFYFACTATTALCTGYFLLFSVFSSGGAQSIFLVIFPIMILGYRILVWRIFLRRLHDPVLEILWYLAADFYPKTFRAFSFVSIRDPKVFVVALASEAVNVASPLLRHLLLGLFSRLRLRVSPLLRPSPATHSYSGYMVRHIVTSTAPPWPPNQPVSTRTETKPQPEKPDRLPRHVLQATVKSLSTIVSVFAAMVTTAVTRYGPAQGDFPFSPTGLPNEDYVRGTIFAVGMLVIFVAGHVISGHVLSGYNDRSRKAVGRANRFIGRHTFAMLGIMLPGVVLPSFIFPKFQDVFYEVQPSRYSST